MHLDLQHWTPYLREGVRRVAARLERMEGEVRWDMAEVARWLLRLCGVLNSNSHFCGVSSVWLGSSGEVVGGGSCLWVVGGGEVAVVVKDGSGRRVGLKKKRKNMNFKSVLRSLNYLFSAPATTLTIISAPAPAPAPATALYWHLKLV